MADKRDPHDPSNNQTFLTIWVASIAGIVTVAALMCGTSVVNFRSENAVKVHQLDVENSELGARVATALRDKAQAEQNAARSAADLEMWKKMPGPGDKK